MKNRSIFFIGLVLILLVCAGGLTAQGQFEAGSGPAAAAEFPLSKVVLFTSGVGYFQREGEVTGNAEIDLFFKTATINDLLKSLVVQDLDGGLVTGVTYSSRDPLTRTLQSFAVDLTGNPNLAGILAQIRGEDVELYTSRPLTGTILGIEARASGEHTADTFLNLLTNEGLQSIDLAGVQKLRFLNPRLQEELNQALALLAESRNAEKKRVTLAFSGTGTRRVRVGYLIEAPLWKTSYRLVLGEENEHYLQGWAIVENTGDEDWRNVSLSLVSGRPISFTMDLYRPLYVPRPHIEPELYASTAPQRYEEDMGTAAAPSRAPMAKSRQAESLAMPEEALSYAADELDLRQGAAAAADTLEAGNFFRYLIEHPVTIPRQESAMLPIVSRSIEGRRVSVYNRKAHAKHPLHGLKLVNSTGLDLMGGPLTVFEEGSYAGDALIDNLSAGSERLISFALDLDTEVAASERSAPETLLAVRISRGSLISSLSLRRELTYTIKNSDDRSRALLVEHPLNPDWELVAPERPAETTRSAYRFLVEVEPGETGELQVVLERLIDRTVLLTNLDDKRISYFLSAASVNPRVKKALQGLSERKAALAAVVGERQQEERTISTIHKEQSRIRENMGRLDRNSDLYKRYVSLLNDQEDRLEAALARSEELLTRERRLREELDRYILSLDV